MNSLPQIIPGPKSRATMCAKTLKIQLSTRPTAAILNFALSQIPPTLSRGSPPLNFYLTFIEDKSTEKSSYALHGHGSAPDDPTMDTVNKVFIVHVLGKRWFTVVLFSTLCLSKAPVPFFFWDNLLCRYTFFFIRITKYKCMILIRNTIYITSQDFFIFFICYWKEWNRITSAKLCHLWVCLKRYTFCGGYIFNSKAICFTFFTN